LNRGIFAWFWHFMFGEDDDHCRRCAADETVFPPGTAPAIAPGCESYYCRRCCRRYCQCGAAQADADAKSVA
jgi:hypothetical protein